MNLVKTSETRFANSKRFVFMNVTKSMPAIISTLTSIQEGINQSSSTKDRQEASDAASLQGRLLNKQFLLRIGAETDIYNQYGVLINIAQTGDILPHDRLDGMDAIINHLEQMQISIEHKNCDTNKPCKWPVYHKAVDSLKQKGEIYDVIVIDDYPGRSGIGANQTRKISNFLTTSAKKDVLEAVQTQASSLLQKLISGLKTDVFSADERQKINLSRTITDMEYLYNCVLNEGPEKTFALQVEKYIKSIRDLPVTSLKEVPSSVLEKQFQALLYKLQENPVTTMVSIINNKDKKDKKDSVSRAILRVLFASQHELYQGIEMIMQAISVSCVKFGVESVVESHVSHHEIHFSSERNADESVMEQELKVSLNGPTLNNCDAIVKEALDSHFKKRWHFLTSSNLYAFQRQSPTINKLKNIKSKFPFME